MFWNNPAYCPIAFPGGLHFPQVCIEVPQEIPPPRVIGLPLGNFPELTFCSAMISPLPEKLAGKYVSHVTVPQ
jgi:hypothetical protein